MCVALKGDWVLNSGDRREEGREVLERGCQETKQSQRAVAGFGRSASSTATPKRHLPNTLCLEDHLGVVLCICPNESAARARGCGFVIPEPYFADRAVGQGAQHERDVARPFCEFLSCLEAGRGGGKLPCLGAA